jgi:hypothetical protein
VVEDKPIEQEHYRQKQSELDRVEKHGGLFCGGKDKEI